jgi:protein SERAC1
LDTIDMTSETNIWEVCGGTNVVLDERANNMLEQLASFSIGDRPIAIVTHSLGGILAKAMLRASSECSDAGWKRISENTRLVAFLATPHTGAALGSVVKFFIPRLASTHVALLSNDNGFLTNLNHSYRDLAAHRNIATVSYYEKFKTKNIFLVVSEESADPGVSGTRPVAVDADHLTICKPASRTSLIFISLVRHIRETLKSCPVCPIADNSFAADDYAQMSTTDRRDLLQKLIDAGREHEYQKANDLQNKFSQRYHKLGLYTEAKAQSDAILASVEQRFITSLIPLSQVHQDIGCETPSCRIPVAVLRRRGRRRTVVMPLRGLSRPMMSQ